MCYNHFFLTRLLIWGILFSTVVNAVFVARLLISGILFSTIVNAVFCSRLLVSGILFSTVVNAVFPARLLVSGILFSTVGNAAFVTKLLISGNLFSNFVLSVSYLVFKINLLVSILSTFATNLLYTAFLTTSFFTTLLNLLRSVGTETNFSISNLSTSVFELDKLVFNAKP